MRMNEPNYLRRQELGVEKGDGGFTVYSKRQHAIGSSFSCEELVIINRIVSHVCLPCTGNAYHPDSIFSEVVGPIGYI